jgi:hypothetical protein
MGQYYRFVNVDALEWFDASAFDEGVKTPHLCPKSMEALGRLLMTSERPEGWEMAGEVVEPLPDGRWCGDRVVILGDYARKSICVDARDGEYTPGHNLYEEIDEPAAGWTNIADQIGGKLYERDDR